MLTPSEAEDRVSKGARYLDQVRPGWASQIDVGTLNLGSDCFCIIGQLYRTFSGWVDGSQFDVIESQAHGFCLSTMAIDTTSELDAGYRLLQNAWILEIASRRAAEVCKKEIRIVETIEA